MKQDQIVKLLVGIATLVFLLWFFTKSGIIQSALSPKVEEGKLGSPAVAGALVVVTEILAAIGGAVIVMTTGVWKFAQSLIGKDEEALDADEFLSRILDDNALSPERRANLQHAVIIAIEKRDKVRMIKAAELLAGSRFLTTKTGG